MPQNPKIKENYVFFATVHPSSDIRTFHKMAKVLVKKGYQITFIVTHDKEEIIDGVKIIPLPTPKKSI